MPLLQYPYIPCNKQQLLCVGRHIGLGFCCTADCGEAGSNGEFARRLELLVGATGFWKTPQNLPYTVCHGLDIMFLRRMELVFCIIVFGYQWNLADIMNWDEIEVPCWTTRRAIHTDGPNPGRRRINLATKLVRSFSSWSHVYTRPISYVYIIRFTLCYIRFIHEVM